jgi:hypothetical protein
MIWGWAVWCRLAALFSFATSTPGAGHAVTDSSARMERNRQEAEKFSDLAKAASSPFLRAYYWNTALRYLSSEGELSRAQSDSPALILSEKARSSVEVLAKGIEQRNDKASLAAVTQDRSLESESTERTDERRTLETLKRLYRELHLLCTPSENS